MKSLRVYEYLPSMTCRPSLPPVLQLQQRHGDEKLM